MNLYEGIALGIFVLLYIPISLIDIRELRIPDWLTGPGVLLLGGVRLWEGGQAGGGPAAAGFLGAAVFAAAVLLLARALTGGLGLGDVKYAPSLGLLCGFPGVITALGLACTLALAAFAVSLPVCALAGKERPARLPFGPFLGFGAILAKIFTFFAAN
jgi:prepilin signal peptidase PulO-like enzyme (type II secretory pathway)